MDHVRTKLIPNHGIYVITDENIFYLLEDSLERYRRLRLRQRIECLVSLEVGGGEVGPLFFCSNPGRIREELNGFQELREG
jgi:hypothetical protein